LLLLLLLLLNRVQLPATFDRWLPPCSNKDSTRSTSSARAAAAAAVTWQGAEWFRWQQQPPWVMMIRLHWARWLIQACLNGRRQIDAAT